MRPLPGYWMNEQSGALAAAVRAFLEGGPMRPEHVGLLRAYFRLWVEAGDWRGPDVAALRADARGLDTRRALAAWLERAVAAGIDPL